MIDWPEMQSRQTIMEDNQEKSIANAIQYNRTKPFQRFLELIVTRMANFIYLFIIEVFAFQTWHALALNFGKERVINVVNRIAAEVAIMNEGECIDSLSKFRDALEGGNASTIVLCPYSVFNMHGREPLSLKTDTKVVCGADGSVSNNCVINGGATQFVSDCECNGKGSYFGGSH